MTATTARRANVRRRRSVSSGEGHSLLEISPAAFKNATDYVPDYAYVPDESADVVDIAQRITVQAHHVDQSPPDLFASEIAALIQRIPPPRGVSAFSQRKYEERVEQIASRGRRLARERVSPLRITAGQRNRRIQALERVRAADRNYQCCVRTLGAELQGRRDLARDAPASLCATREDQMVAAIEQIHRELMRINGQIDSASKSCEHADQMLRKALKAWHKELEGPIVRSRAA